MARQTTPLVSGKIGTVVFYVMDGKQYVKVKGPRKIKQTEATKASASKFGQASHTARVIRSAFPALKPLSNREMRNGLTSAVHKWMLKPHGSVRGAHKVIHGLSEYEFNKQVPLSKRLKKVNLEVEWDSSGKVIVSIPAITRIKHIVAPGNIEAVELWIGVVSCKPGVKTAAVTKKRTRILIPYSGSIPAQQVELPIPVEAGTMSVVAAGLRYIIIEDGDKSEFEEDRKWMPACVLEAVYWK